MEKRIQKQQTNVLTTKNYQLMLTSNCVSPHEHEILTINGQGAQAPLHEKYDNNHTPLCGEKKYAFDNHIKLCGPPLCMLCMKKNI